MLIQSVGRYLSRIIINLHKLSGHIALELKPLIQKICKTLGWEKG
ncbi:hypothetical protein APX70_05128 [Pseudomonas syringae pv. maculicola]|uniref:Uncharacterized protein n=1 Tax=Pseudomonas syringae pv. maculicola TaxID=59511 RepID=A0A3M2ZNS7_PSEYM|nr:hypothetical protein APX70_05128 [Pseudomonas syringae pv. maculicola]